ncbi:ATP-dependent Clp protease proteolytic subunit [Haematococcus lacustris]|uniref:ATP-dependent Clp protease proteolytic subunit n=1 Tax=Haematococcus lacustris TaxID=44745 RepID=A0A6A0AKG0_HAELA|nr:ATP-dependent Clp protease proteolytic subunit [Haematococcus lacustris]
MPCVVPQLSARYYMEFTGMDQDEVEENTNRDFFMTPEIAVQQGLIDGVIGDEEDLYAPPAVTKQLRDMGLNDDLTPNLVKWYR